jgi:hypothetical protein
MIKKILTSHGLNKALLQLVVALSQSSDPSQ